MTQQEQRAIWREEWRKRHPVKPPRTFYNPKMGRVVTRDHYATRIFWNKDMLDFLKANYATTLNEDLAGCLGVSPRTMVRKARDLGLQKDRAWLREIWDERRMMAHAVSKKLGFPGPSRKASTPVPKQSLNRRNRMNMSASKWNNTVWIARDFDGSLELFLVKPKKGKHGYWVAPSRAVVLSLPKRFYPEVTVENSPQELIVDSNLIAESD